MITMMRLGLHEAAIRWRMTIVMGLTVATSLICFLVLNAYRTDLISRYSVLAMDFLVIEENGSMGEWAGSRLPVSVALQLAGAGASLIVPEIHTIVGTTPENAIMLRGVALDNYAQVETFKITAGRALQTGDPSRQAMVGSLLAEERHLSPGGIIEIRGRNFTVSGIFSSGTYADHEAWISLEDAQTLLGWGSDVSVFVIPADENLKAGDTLSGGLSVVQKGEAGVNMVKEFQPMFTLLELVTAVLGVAAAVVLANMLWRLAWLQRHDLAILQSIGFGKLAVAGFLLMQGVGIALLGFGTGVLVSVVLGKFTQLSANGSSIHAIFDARTLLLTFFYACLITAAGSVLPAWWLAHLNLAVLLRSE
jgi:ABC-type lipoprotein release transport system permease subunit